MFLTGIKQPEELTAAERLSFVRHFKEYRVGIFLKLNSKNFRACFIGNGLLFRAL